MAKESKFRHVIHTAFSFPVINGLLYLGQRGIMPRQGYWGPVGGKSEATKDNIWNEPEMIEYRVGQTALSFESQICKMQGREYTQGTAVRELCEELFLDRRFPDDFSKNDISNIVCVGCVHDSVEVDNIAYDTSNYVYLMQLNHDDFCLNKREITEFKPLQEITNRDRIFPVGKLALAQVHFAIEFGLPVIPEAYRMLHQQIEPFLKDDFIQENEGLLTDMVGPVVYYGDRYFGDLSNNPFFRGVLSRIRGRTVIE